MDVLRDHIIHSKGGFLGDGVTSISDAQRIAHQAFNTDAPNGVVLHFHGGLVSREAGEGIAKRLAVQYNAAGTYSIFSVWESGFLEALRNNLKDILNDKVFQELVKKVSEWVLRKGAGSVATRGSGQNIDRDALRKQFDQWFAGQSAEPPIKETSPSPGSITKDLGFDEDELTQIILDEFEQDPDFEASLAGLAITAGRVSLNATRGASIEPVSVENLVDPKVIKELFPEGQSTTKGGITWVAVAKFVAKVIIAVLQRFANHHDHGAYTTIVEEVLRAAYLDKVGEVVWGQMKKDAGVDAFSSDKSAGKVVLETWRECIAAGDKPPRITLVGHSTGAIYINAWLEHSAKICPDLKYDLIFLAPACRTEEFIAMYGRNKGRIANFRLFGMRDAVEQQDRLVSIIYPRSLLYFVSGVVEGGSDVALLGMERFVLFSDVFDEPYLNAARKYLKQEKFSVWSIAKDLNGLSSASVSHGDFDDDEVTLTSVGYILSKGY